MIMQTSCCDTQVSTRYHHQDGVTIWQLLFIGCATGNHCNLHRMPILSQPGFEPGSPNESRPNRIWCKNESRCPGGSVLHERLSAIEGLQGFLQIWAMRRLSPRFVWPSGDETEAEELCLRHCSHADEMQLKEESGFKYTLEKWWLKKKALVYMFYSMIRFLQYVRRTQTSCYFQSIWSYLVEHGYGLSVSRIFICLTLNLSPLRSTCTSLDFLFAGCCHFCHTCTVVT